MMCSVLPFADLPIVPAPQRILPASCLPHCQGFVLTSPLLLTSSSSLSSFSIAAPHLSRPTARAPLRSEICHQRCLGPDLLSICNTMLNARHRSPVNDHHHIAFSTLYRRVTLRLGTCASRVDLLDPHEFATYSALHRWQVGGIPNCWLLMLPPYAGYSHSIKDYNVRHGRKDDSCNTSSFHGPSFF
jgi:hypothetical protein